jgi:hypothetical protein
MRRRSVQRALTAKRSRLRSQTTVASDHGSGRSSPEAQMRKTCDIDDILDTSSIHALFCDMVRQVLDVLEGLRAANGSSASKHGQEVPDDARWAHGVSDHLPQAYGSIFTLYSGQGGAWISLQVRHAAQRVQVLTFPRRKRARLTIKLFWRSTCP